MLSLPLLFIKIPNNRSNLSILEKTETVFSLSCVQCISSINTVDLFAGKRTVLSIRMDVRSQTHFASGLLYSTKKIT